MQQAEAPKYRFIMPERAVLPNGKEVHIIGISQGHLFEPVRAIQKELAEYIEKNSGGKRKRILMEGNSDRFLGSRNRKFWMSSLIVGPIINAEFISKLIRSFRGQYDPKVLGRQYKRWELMHNIGEFFRLSSPHKIEKVRGRIRKKVKSQAPVDQMIKRALGSISINMAQEILYESGSWENGRETFLVVNASHTTRLKKMLSNPALLARYKRQFPHYLV